MPERSIVHINVAHFAASVERLIDSRLRRRPLLIAPPIGERSFVLDLSDDAYREGVRKGMALLQAKRIARGAAVVRPHYDIYQRVMARLGKEAQAYSPLVEQAGGAGHIFVDLTGAGALFGPAPDVAWRLRKQARKDLGLDPIWTLAANKLVAKVASRLVKPDGEYIVEPGDEQEFLGPLPVRLLPCLATGDFLRLQELELNRIGDLPGLGAENLRLLFGRRAQLVLENARGIDDTPVLPPGRQPPGRRMSSAEAGHSFDGEVNDAGLVESALFACVREVAFDLRERSLAVRRMKLTVEYADRRKGRGQATVADARCDDFSMFEQARLALERAWTRRVRLRSLKLVCDRLESAPVQLDLFEATGANRRRRELLEGLDAIRRRFGAGAVEFGRVKAGSTEGRP
jgi:DNA polymerase IV